MLHMLQIDVHDQDGNTELNIYISI